MKENKSDFLKAMEKSQKEESIKYCEYKCSKYCEMLNWDMSKINDKYVCKACYNCAVDKQ